MISGGEKESLRERIFGLGFDAVRFTDLKPISDIRLREWVEAGYHADMDWLARSIEKRLNPQLVLEAACSVIMLGVNYLPEEGESARSQRGFAKYSLYRDYHDTLVEGLKKVGALLEERFGLGPREYRYYTDTGPVMERGWAAAAGMGWQGKNGMLISREHGNWLLLATVFVPLEIEADGGLRKGVRRLGDRVERTSPEEPSHLGLLCGKCVRCIDACPTGAIVEPGILDTRKCISYQTIENRGVIPRELRARFGGRVFGCDICLDVCPWNRFAEAGRSQLLEARYAAAELGLLDLLRMDVETFREVFRKMPQKRTKLRGLKRNACIAAGNLLRCEDWWPKGDAERAAFLDAVKQELILLAEDEEPLVRGHAVWAVYQLCGDEAVSLLGKAREAELDESVLAEYLSAGTADAT